MFSKPFINQLFRCFVGTKFYKFLPLSPYHSLWYLQFFSCVSWGFLPTTTCWWCRQLLYNTQFFLSPLFLWFFNLEFRNLLLSVPSVLSCFFCSLSCPSYSFLLFFLFLVLFSPSVYLLYFLTSLIVFFSSLLSLLLSFPFTLFCLLFP